MGPHTARSMAVIAALALAITAGPSYGARRATAPITGPAGVCSFYSGGGSLVGGASLHDLPNFQDPGNPSLTVYPITVDISVHDLARGLYQIWVADLTIIDGQIAGCAANQIGSVRIPASGQASWSGKYQTLLEGEHNFQVIVDKGNPFDDFTANVTGPMNLDVV